MVADIREFFRNLCDEAFEELLVVESVRIKDYALENRPRERLQQLGASALSDAELLALVLRTGIRGEDVVTFCNRLLSVYDLSSLAQCSVQELLTFSGLGVAKACQIVAVFELHRRYTFGGVKSSSLRCAEDVYAYCGSRLSEKDREMFVVLHLDAKNRVVKEEVVSVGTLSSSLVHPREVFKSAVRESSHAVLFVHNHPSGDVTPSEEDAEITQRLREAGKVLGARVLDHVIVGVDGWYSFVEGGGNKVVK